MSSLMSNRWAGMVVGMVLTTLSANAFTLELGSEVKTIELTPEYKEAALKATLPLFSDFAHKLQLPVSYPLTRRDIIDYGMTPFQRKDTVADTLFIETKEEFRFSLFLGVVRSFSRPAAYCLMQDIHTITNYFGEVKITRA